MSVTSSRRRPARPRGRTRRAACLGIAAALLVAALPVVVPAAAGPADAGVRVAPFRWEPLHRTTL
ncbi:MAG: hypothetical protein ACKOTZ_05875 [Chloroflexota bacterium]